MTTESHGEKVQSAGSATVSFGPWKQEGSNFAGKSVKEVRGQLAQFWKMPDNATAYNGKTKLDDDYVIQPSDNIKFHRNMGNKGI
jgi:hypothetical protein